MLAALEGIHQVSGASFAQPFGGEFALESGERSFPSRILGHFFLKVPLIFLMLICLTDVYLYDAQALIAAICAVAMVIATPSGFYAGVAVESEGEQVLR